MKGFFVYQKNNDLKRQRSINSISINENRKQHSFDEIYIFLKCYLSVANLVFDKNGSLVLSPKTNIDTNSSQTKKLLFLYEILKNYSSLIRGYFLGIEPSPWVRLIDGFFFDQKEKASKLSKREISSFEYALNSMLGGIYGFWSFLLKMKRTAFKGCSFYFGGTFWALSPDMKEKDFLKGIDVFQIKFKDPVYYFHYKGINLLWHP